MKNPSDSLGIARSKICDGTIVIMSLIVIPLLAASFYRLVTIGWQPVMAVHIAEALCLWAMTLFRKRIALNVKAVVLIAIFVVTGLGGLWQLGLIAPAIGFLVGAPIIAVVLLGARAAYVVLALIVVFATAIGYATVMTGRLPTIDFATYAIHQSSWLTAGLVWLLVGAVITVATATLNKSFLRSLKAADETKHLLLEQKTLLEKKFDERTRDLQISEHRFKDFAKSTSDWFWETDADMRFSYLSERAGAVSDLPPSDIIGKTRLEVIGADVNLPKWKEHQETLRQHKPFRDFEYVFQGPNGRRQNISASGVPVFDADGTFSGYRGTASDITLRIKADERVNQFKTTLDRTQDCIFMFDPDTLKFFYVNQGAMDQVGYSEQELLEMYPFDIKPNYDEAAFREFADQLVQGPEKSITFETVHEHRNGYHIPVEIFLQYVSPENETARFVAIVRDITERKKIDAAKSAFISTVSHELRTPLTSIVGSLGIATSGKVGDVPEKMESILGIAYKNADRLTLLVNDILDMDKLESGMMDFNMVALDVSQLIEEAVNANEGYGEKFGVTFQTSGTDQAHLAKGDRDRLHQVLSNLMSNAAKFSPEGGVVNLSIAHRDNRIKVSVSDKGPGIPTEFHEKIFDKFTQSDSSNTRQQGGTGLGLSITKAIVESHGGSVEFETVMGEGTTFSFYLPEAG